MGITRFILMCVLLVACVGSAQPEDDMNKIRRSTNQQTTNAVSQKFLTRSNSSMSVQTPDYEESADYTVRFNMGIPPSLQPHQARVVAQATALIQASVGGVTTFRRVSILNGTSVTVTAEKVRVIVTDSSQAVSGAPIDYQYDISCMIGRGTRPNVGQPPIFIPQYVAGSGLSNFPGATGQLAPGADATWNWPDDTGAISLFVASQPFAANAANGDIYIEEQSVRGDATGTTTATLAFYAVDLTPGFVPINPGVNTIKIHNQSSTVTYNYSLFLGVDG